MKIALIEAPIGYIPGFSWEDVYFPETPFPICDFLNDEQNHLCIWDFFQASSFDVQKFIQELQAFQPVVIGINDHQTTNGLVLERLIKQMFPRCLVFFSADAMTQEELLDRANENAFNLRQRAKPMAGKLRLRRTWPEETLFAHLNETDRVQALEMEKTYLERFQLEVFKQQLTAPLYRQNLYMLEILSDLLAEDLDFWSQKTLRILDVGAGDWAYGPAIYHFFRYAYTDTPREVFLTGIELDPYRTDYEGYSKVDYALSYVDPIANHCRYLIQNVLDYQPQKPHDIVLQFLPFVLKHAHLLWGLPLRFYKPAEVLAHIYSHLLVEQGYLVVANEIEAEFQAQKALFEQVPFEPLVSGRFYSQLKAAYMGYVFSRKKPQ